MSEFNHEAWASSMAQMKTTTPEIGRSFGAMFQGLMKAGALTVREKELVALGIGISQRCEPCIYSHVEKCLKAGATPEQIYEVAGVAVVMGGGPVYTHVPSVLQAVEAMQAKTA